jgi:hypothetical protein
LFIPEIVFVLLDDFGMNMEEQTELVRTKLEIMAFGDDSEVAGSRGNDSYGISILMEMMDEIS